MHGDRITETKYNGYLIKPTKTGFRVYRKSYFVAEYGTMQIAKHRIDGVVAEKERLMGRQRNPKSKNHDSDQLDLFQVKL